MAVLSIWHVIVAIRKLLDREEELNTEKI